METAPRRLTLIGFVLLLLLARLPGAALAAPKTQIQLLLSSDAARPGETIWAGLQMDVPAPWHVYWRNGGDAGEPTRITWSLPDGVTAGDIQWPVPLKEIDKSDDFSLITYVYKGQVILPVQITLSKDLPQGPITLKATAHWMECSDICVMADADSTATLTVASEDKPSASAALIEQWRQKVPRSAAPLAASASWETEGGTNGRPVVIEWHTTAAAADFYPYANSNFDVGGDTQELPSSNGVVRLRKIVKTNDVQWPDRLTGILVAEPASANPVAVEANIPITPPVVAAVAPIPAGSLVTMLIFAFLGGLILNVMPCVLPVIALKILGFVNQSSEQPGRIRILGLIYGAGVIASFLVLAGLAIGVKQAGGVANWGDVFRRPEVQTGLTILMMLIALNLFGVFEITLGSRALGAASTLASGPGASGAFFNGVLATILATPCTAPFLSAALAFAFTQPPAVILMVFATAGLGLAFPFVLLCLQPKWLKFLPKPGAWMEKFKVAMGFPMLATAVWLMWLSATREEDVLWLGLFLVVLAFAAWLWGQFVQRGTRHKGLAAVICACLVAADFGLLLQSAPDSNAIPWKPWSPEAVADAQHAGHPVLVDFTAKSCLTCQLNKRSSLEIPSTRAKLKQIGAVALEADFTRQDPAIARELAEFHRGGVPLVLVYPKDPARAPEELPVLLTPAVVLRALDRAR